jgi:hypothetical protein
MISIAGPMAARTADSRAISSDTCGRPSLIFTPPKPASLARSASSTSACGSRCSQPPSVVYIGTDACAPPAITCRGRPALRQRRSHSAVSIAACAMAVMAPTVVACVRNISSRQTRSTSAASRPIRAGPSARSISFITEAPPVPIV